ncbi:MAG TPA: hypothetical protein VFN79_05325 [Steroidobacteraceae bacterium]|nr:hypothetical protein [Steroidobacteraceae bacterium]
MPGEPHGREDVPEGLVIGEITTGAENDLVQATRLARRMIARWGMGSLGRTNAHKPTPAARSSVG